MFRLVIDLPIRKIITVLVILVASLLVTHIALQVWHFRVGHVPTTIREFFDVDLERNIPTWFSTILLFIAGMLLLLIANRKHISNGQWIRAWYGLAFGFFFLSLDEIAGFHETLNHFTAFSWVYAAAPVALIIIVLYLRFLFHLPAQIRNLFILSAAIFLSGALGVEVATDIYDEKDLMDTLAYNLWTPVEEGMEMGGVILFIYALLRYNADNGQSI
ncbi:MAG: hypothetical protein GKS01_00470 [Alphaproteobacteria bacterium]|nr:hypothetical protein [Alphaproteobacteria bacterium]